MPGSAQWKLYSNIDDLDYSDLSHGSQNDCWVCDQHIYSLIFWNELIGKQEELPFDVSDQLEKLNDFSKFQGPVIMGQFNNWKPQKLVEIKEFCDKIN